MELYSISDTRLTWLNLEYVLALKFIWENKSRKIEYNIEWWAVKHISNEP